MCLSPVLIKNVNYGNTSKLNFIKDTTSQYIPVPCGRCSVCLALKQQYIVQRVQMESLSHDLYFGTLTYNNDCLPVLEVGDFKLAHVDLSDFQSMIKMIRKYCDLPPFKYFAVTEYGGKRHRPHMHFILSFPRDDRQTLADRWSFSIKLWNIFLKYWRRNVNYLDGKFTKSGKLKVNTRNPVWKSLCTFARNRKKANFDLHYLDPNSCSEGLDSVAFYVSKYCLKYDSWVDKLKSKLFFNLDEDTYKETWEIIKPRRIMSKGFGSPYDPKVVAHINKGIILSLRDPVAMYPYFISPVNGATFPLSPYYSTKFLQLSDLIVFNRRKPCLTDYDMMIDSYKDISVDEIIQNENRMKLVQDTLDRKHTYFDDDANSINNFNILVHEKVIRLSDCIDDFIDSDGWTSG